METQANLVRRSSHSLFSGQAESAIKLQYFSSWSSPHIHYNANHAGTWTTMPGKAFTPAGAPGQFRVEIAATSLEFVCHDGNGGAWDKAPGNQNYKIATPGSFVLKDGKIEQQLAPPRPPQFAVVNEVGSGSVSLSWNPPKDMSPSEIGGYAVFRDGELVHRGDASLTWVDTGVKACTSYFYQVATLNVQGTQSKLSDNVTAMTNTPGKPGPPSWLKVSATGADFVELEWKPPRDQGGASVTAYNVFRGEPDAHASTSRCVGVVIGRDPNSGKDREVLTWRDTSCERGVAYAYCVSAVHMPDSSMARSRSQAQIIEELQKKASNSLLAVEPDENEGPRCEAVRAKAVAQLKAPRMGDGEPHIMLQAFNWDSCFNKSGWYNVVKSQVGKLEAAGIDMAWLPPPSDCVDSRGYLPKEWFNLNSKYGSDAELRSLVQALVEAQIAPVADIVINHRCASQQDGNGRWTSFKNPDWESWAICNDDPSGTGCGGHSTGPNMEYAPNLDHQNPKIQEDSRHYIKWLMEDVGFRSIRLDYVLGYGPWLQEGYVRAAGTPYCVAEYWHGDPNVLTNYINATKGVVAVYDFPVYYTLKGAIHSNDFSALNQGGKPPGIMGRDPVRAVTFVENHDTSHLEIVGGKFGNNEQVTRAYAYILTHNGIPSIFWSDWSDRGEDVQNKLAELCRIRRSVGVHCDSRVSINCAHGGLYAAYIDGKHGTVAFKMGTNDWGPNGDGWNLRATGHEYAVWTKGGI